MCTAEWLTGRLRVVVQSESRGKLKSFGHFHHNCRRRLYNIMQYDSEKWHYTGNHGTKFVGRFKIRSRKDECTGLVNFKNRKTPDKLESNRTKFQMVTETQDVHASHGKILHG